MDEILSRLLRREMLPAVLLVAIVVADLSLGQGHSASTLVVVAPLLASSLVGPRLTALYGLLAVATWVVLGFVDDQFTTASSRSAQWVRLAGILVGAMIAVAASADRLRREARLHRVERVAEAAQRAILEPVPRRIGSIELAARYESSVEDATVGGDLYAAAATRHGARVLIGDVRGHGLAAVRLAAAVLGAFRERANDEPDPVDLLERLDAAVRRVAVEGDFVTAALVQITDDATTTVVNAGHPPPLLLRGKTARELLPATIRPPLGFSGRALPVVESLVAGDRILLFTDGATEARRPADRAFRADDAVMQDALAAETSEQTVNRVFDGVLGWSQGQLQDDVAVLSARYEPVTADQGRPAGARGGGYRSPTP